LTESIQTNYTDGQTGIYEIIANVTKIVNKQDPELIELL